MADRGMIWGVVLLPLGILCACAAIAIERTTVASYATPLDWYFSRELGPSGVAALQERHALQGNQFLRLKERPPEIDPALFARMRRVASLGELKGMGLWNALALEELGINGAEDLAWRNPAELRVQLGALRRNVRLEEVAVWIREAKRIHPGSK